MGKAAIPLMFLGGTGAALATGFAGGDRDAALRNMLGGAALGAGASNLLGMGATSAMPSSAVPMANATGVLGEAGKSGLMGLLPDYAAGGISPLSTPLASAANPLSAGASGLTANKAMLLSKLLSMGTGQRQPQPMMASAPMMQRGRPSSIPLAQNPQMGVDPNLLLQQQLLRQRALMGGIG